ncbi:hypothetical protein [Solimicrobium silvestre]|uniref:Uncharacterized protein n=1 Tax=Solimicrobium silvestre TaxID=2099400 RepID=A0A2S9H0Y3_9BURK|nr:hypothetical protein [Solimicrobium silvestre]PRC93639.1 hypothetical protein S2091_1640 [Solimicrobium silvestre]
MNETFQVKINGIKDGVEIDHVIYRLVILFKRSKNEVQRMFETEGFIVKKGVDLPKAIKYKTVLENSGCVCTIELVNKPDPFTIHDISVRTDKFRTKQESQTSSANISGLNITETNDAATHASATITNEIGTTIGGERFLAQTPQKFCCHCGGNSEVSTIETDFFMDLVFSTQFKKEKSISLALPYCPTCALGIDAPKSSSNTPVKIKDFSRNPNPTRYERSALLFVSMITALMRMIFKLLGQQDTDYIKKIAIKFSNPEYAKAFKKNNKHFIDEGFIKIL